MTGSLAREVIAELRPFDGRLATTWRVAALCALTTLVFMTYGIPLAPIACYLVLFVMKPDPAETILMALGISVLVCIVVALLFFLTRVSIEVPLWRMVILATSSFLFLYIGAASQLGPAGSIIALVIGFVMTLIGEVPFGELATRALLYAWLMALVPMGLIVSFNAAFGRSTVALLRGGLAERLRFVARLLDRDTPAMRSREDVLIALRSGNESLVGYARFVRLFHLVPKAESRALTAAIDRSYAVMLAAMALEASRSSGSGAGSQTLTAGFDGHNGGPEARNDQLQHLVRYCSALADRIEEGGLRANSLTDDQLTGSASPAVDVIDAHLRSIGMPMPVDNSIEKEGFFYTDALSNPVYQRFSLKTTASAVLCYIIYTALDWQDIHTAMITCYVAALGTTGETLHKLTLRIVGCLIGAAMGVLAILFLMPLMTSIGELMVLVFAGILCAAWVSSGSERIAYAGVQIGLAFLLTVLQGFGPDVQMSVAMNRVIGILLGNTVLYLVFTRVWPVSAMATVQQKLSGVLDTLQARFGLQEEREIASSPAQIEKMLTTLESAKEELRFLHFEPRVLRPSAAYLESLRTVIGQTESLILRMSGASAGPSELAMPATLAGENDEHP